MSQEAQPVPARFGDAYRALALRQKTGSGVPFYTRVINRRLGRLIAAAASPLRVSPNAVSLASAALWLAGLALLATVPTSVPVVIVVVVILTLSFGLDAADGQLARLTGRTGRAGEWLDHVLDAARQVAVHLAVLIALFRFADTDAKTLLIPLAFALVASTRFVAQVLAEQLRGGAAPAPAVRPVPRRPGAMIQLPADTGTLNATLLLLPAPTVFLIVYGALALANTGLLAATLVRRFAELAAQDRTQR